MQMIYQDAALFYLEWPWDKPFLEILRQKLHFDVYFLHFWQKSTCFRHFCPCLTMNDLCWPRDYFFWKDKLKSPILRYYLNSFEKVLILTFFAIFDLEWPRITLTFFSKADVKSFILIIIICILCVKFKLWLKMTQICNLTPNPKFLLSE